jgi:lipopolysaccharide export system protein LptA
MKHTLLILALCMAPMGAALAEKADSSKPADVVADSFAVDDVKQVRTLTGHVVLTRGTLIMKADKAVVRVDPEGYQFVTFTSNPGSVATFRQKRDGGDLWVEGEAERIEYDDKTENVKMYSKAKLRRLDGTKVSDEAEGAYVGYDSRKEYFNVENSVSGESKPGGGRVHMVIQPRKQTPAAPAPVPATPGK